MTKPPQPLRTAPTLATLESSALFGTLDAAALQSVLARARTIQLDRGQVYQSRGDRVEGVVIVARGYLRVCLSNAAGKRHVVWHLGPAEVFNLLPVVDGGPAIHDAEAGTDTELIVVPAAVFLELQRAHPGLAAAAQRTLNTRARLMYDELADVMLLTLSQRCARTLLGVVHDFGEPVGKGGARSVRLSQSEFAELLGNARPVVNRELMKLQRKGVIELGYQRIVVLQPAALRAAAGLRLRT